MLHVIENERLYPFMVPFFSTHRSGVLTMLFGRYMAGATWNCCCLGAHSVYTIQPGTSLQCHFIQSHIHRAHACLAATCHLHFWQSDQGLLRASAVTQGWNGYHITIHCRSSYKEPLNEGTVPGSSSSVTFWLQLLLKVHAYVWRNDRVPAEGMAFPS